MNIIILEKIWPYLKKNILVVLLLFLSLNINISSVFYYFYRLNNLVIFFSLLVSLVLTGLFIYFTISHQGQQEKPALIAFSGNYSNKFWLFVKILLTGLILVLFYLLFKALVSSGSFLAINSPWNFISADFWLLLSALLILLFINFYLQSRSSYFFIIIFYFLFFSISFFIYKIAFGYDQLLHQRAIKEIINFGLIEPKTIYYIGQYVLEFFILKIWPFSLELLDRLLVPILSSVLLPITFIFNFKKRGFNRIIWPLVLLLILPFSIFTYTVPQNLAFLFLLILLLFSFNKYFIDNRYNFIFLLSLAFTIFFIHPLAGVPAIIFTFILWLDSFVDCQFLFVGVKNKIKTPVSFFKFLKYLSYLFQVIILPLLLIFSGGRLAPTSFNFSNWVPRFLGQENVLLNFIYFFGLNRNIWLLVLFLLATFFVIKYNRQDLKIFYFNSITLLSSYFVSLFIDFPFLSQIDKSSYANRILIISFLFLIPIFYEIFICLMKKIKEEKIFFRIIILIFLSGLLLSSLYLNYPRKDNYFNSRSFSVSRDDFAAVKFIEEHKENDNYIVLANQQVGASAIKEYGFKRYYGPWFYYSVQTGGLPYDYYLKMIENPNKDLMIDLMKELGTDGAYLVINDYWWGFDRIIQELKIISDEAYDINNGKLKIFYFKK
ncbi:MAG TPA: hypothetical protein PK142_02190 [bacterium]|nr:hypothetical protein [bacterium]